MGFLEDFEGRVLRGKTQKTSHGWAGKSPFLIGDTFSNAVGFTFSC